MFEVVLESFPRREIEKFLRIYRKFNHRTPDREVHRRLHAVLHGKPLLIARVPLREVADNLRKEAELCGGTVRIEEVPEEAAAA